MNLNWFWYLNCKRINSLLSCINFRLGEILISTQPFKAGAWCTTLSKKSDKTNWSLIRSPYRYNDLITSGISWKSCKFFCLSKIITWLTMASNTFPKRNSSMFSSTLLLQSWKVLKLIDSSCNTPEDLMSSANDCNLKSNN